ncbi:winged helix-turn-helix transcriptional regulator [Nocardia sp. alder85J]|uniref:winged helix-turn-helix transcriptional regulator n=1 Tax=Nocardia sp. alder85J TaxID=2862949 RepID=UPI001CD47F68|nr:helix-turn-helix domain-containing protein [Nocardia sp. alder85J]MCX4094237.1 helix-turn-helix domain-containing protein [Nocardia sp. alder85J]
MPPLDPQMFDDLCPSTLSPIRIGDKWGALLVRCLESGPRRYSELRIPLARITPKVMTQSLRILEQRGFVAREIDGRRVTYALTPLGRSLLEPLNALCAWTDEHWTELVDAYDPDTAALGA